MACGGDGEFSTETELSVCDKAMPMVLESQIDSSSLTDNEQKFVEIEGDRPKLPKITWEEKLAKAKTFKEEGNAKYKTGEYKSAIGKYHRSLLFVKGIESSQQSIPLVPDEALSAADKNIPEDALFEISKLKLDSYNNLAACMLKADNPRYSKVFQYCDIVLEMDPHNTKALYRKGVALCHLSQPEEALKVLKKAAQYGTPNSAIKRYVALCEKELLRQDEKMKEAYRGMFNKQNADKTSEDT